MLNPACAHSLGGLPCACLSRGCGSKRTQAPEEKAHRESRPWLRGAQGQRALGMGTGVPQEDTALQGRRRSLATHAP